MRKMLCDFSDGEESVVQLSGGAMNNADRLGILSVFLTVDGECNNHGPGIWSVFVRTRGCTVGCRWCDTKYSWQQKGGTLLTPEELVESVTLIGHGCQKVTITGGEPLEQDANALGAFIRKLLDRDYTISVETSGTYHVDKFRAAQGVQHHPDLSFIVDFKLSSAQATKNDHSQYVKLRQRDCIKMVIGDRNDFLEALFVSKGIRVQNKRTPIYFSPVHGVLAPAQLLAWMREHDCQELDLRINLQLHKLIWPNDSRIEENEGIDFTKRSLGRSGFLERAHTTDQKL